jgi:hypothetical protein
MPALHDVVNGSHRFLHHTGIVSIRGMRARCVSDVAVKVVLVLPFDENVYEQNEKEKMCYFNKTLTQAKAEVFNVGFEEIFEAHCFEKYIEFAKLTKGFFVGLLGSSFYKYFLVRV